MIVAAGLLEVHVHGSQSLKTKRGVIQSIKRRVRNRFNVSIAEVGGQDTWQRAVLGIAAAGADERGVREQINRVIAFVEDLHLADVIDTDLQVLDLPHEAQAAGALWHEDEDEASGDEPGCE